MTREKPDHACWWCWADLCKEYIHNFKTILLILLLPGPARRSEGKAVVGNGSSLLFFALKSEAAFDVRYLMSNTHSGSKRYVLETQ